MVNLNARAGEAIVGEAQVGFSDLPDTTRAPDHFTWEGACWERVVDPITDVLLVQGENTRAQDAFAARLANILRLNVANLVVTEGATINQLVALAIAGATADFQEAFIQNLRTTGAQIDEAVINDLAANIITSGLFRTAETGQRLEIDSTGLVMWGIDPDGLEYEMVRLGPSGENLITVGDTTISSASVQSPVGSFADLDVGGETLAEILAPFPKGVVARGWNSVAGREIGPEGETELGEVTVPVEDGRAYSLKVEPISAYVPRGGRLSLRIYVEKGYGGDAAPTPTMSSLLYREIVHRDAGGDRPMVVFLGNWLAWEETGATEWRLLFTFRAYDSTDSGTVYSATRPASGALAVSVEDIGPHREDIMTDRTGTTAAPKPPPPVIKRYTKTWSAGGYGGDTSAGDVVQGYYSGVGMRSGSWRFSSAMKTALAGATIEKFEVYLYANHWYWGSGGTASIRATDGNWKGFWGSQVTSTKWPRNSGRWVTVPKDWLPNIANGSVGGVGVSTTSTSTLYYGRFTGNATKFRATFRK